MARPYSLDVRERVVAAVAGGQSCGSASGSMTHGDLATTPSGIVGRTPGLR